MELGHPKYTLNIRRIYSTCSFQCCYVKIIINISANCWAKRKLWKTHWLILLFFIMLFQIFFFFPEQPNQPLISMGKLYTIRYYGYLYFYYYPYHYPYHYYCSINIIFIFSKGNGNWTIYVIILLSMILRRNSDRQQSATAKTSKMPTYKSRAHQWLLFFCYFVQDNQCNDLHWF